MKTYEFSYYGACEDTHAYVCVKDYIDADNLKIAWITAAERAVMQFGSRLDSIDLVTIIER